jgi:menaquinone-dependent protoporphyrinogen oxidase
MRVLATWGAKRGDTKGIARTVGEALKAQGLDVGLAAPRDAVQARGFDAAIIGGALYGNRWHRAARRFVTAVRATFAACRSGSSRAARSTT